MTIIPEIPSNLLSGTSDVRSSLANASSRAISTASDIGVSVENVSSLRSLSVEAKLKEEILKSVLPDSIFNGQSAIDSVPDFEEMQLLAERAIKAYLNTIKIPAIPALRAVPITLPSPAEIMTFVMQRIDELKRKRQAQLLKLQLSEAIKEDTPFTDRRKQETTQTITRNRF